MKPVTAVEAARKEFDAAILPARRQYKATMRAQDTKERRQAAEPAAWQAYCAAVNPARERWHAAIKAEQEVNR